MTDLRRRIAFLDVDGTILAHSPRPGEAPQVAPSTVDAIRAARAAGHLVLLSTGRSAADLDPAVAAIGFDGAITNGGAFAVVAGERVVAKTMPVAALDLLVSYFEAGGYDFILQSDAGVYGSDGMRPLIARYAPGRALPSIAEADPASIAKAVFVSARADGLTALQADLGDRFHIVTGSMPLPLGTNGEVGMPGTTKGSAIEAVLAHVGMDASDAIGIGDSWNDVEMFQVCGTSIAMADADPELQALADEVTTGVLEDGVWNAFVRHGLVVPSAGE